jgi:sec-independent protein translocase protein TatA
MFAGLGPPEMLVVLGVAVLLFGKRLPEVGRSLGKGIIEFKKGLRGIEDEFHSVTTPPPERYEPHRSTDLVETSVPKFEPPTTAPVAHTGYEPQPTQD